MGLMVNALSKIALSKTGQKMYSYLCDPKNQKFLSIATPAVETAVATSFYTVATQLQKNLDDRRKHMLHVQNIGAGIAGLTVSSWLNKGIYNCVEKIVPQLSPEIGKNLHKVSGGLRVGLPILTCCVFTRCLFPALIAAFSGKVEEHRHKKLDKQA